MEINSKVANPFIKWVGGKRKLINQFKDLGLLPPQNINQQSYTYFEPFLGGGAVFFNLKPSKSVLSDTNEELIITYKIVKTKVNELISCLKDYNNSKEFFYRIREKDISKMEPLEIASRFIYLNKTAFNGMFRVNSQGKFNVPYGFYSNPLICDESNLRNVSRSLQNVDIACRDFKEVLNYAKSGDFVYLDPPYYPLTKTSSFTNYTKNGFDTNSQIELKKVFCNLSQSGCYVLLSNSDTDFIRELYGDIKNIKIHKVLAGRSINSIPNKRGKVSEVVISNY